MRKILFIITVFMTAVAYAATYTVDNLPIPYLQDKTQYVSNHDNILSQVAVDSLNLWLGQMEKAHGVQTVLAVVERIQGGETYDFCMALGRKYGIGRKEQNSGLIILLSTVSNQVLRDSVYTHHAGTYQFLRSMGIRSDARHITAPVPILVFR